MDVSVIIVNYNTKSLLKDCLYSIYEHTSEVIFEIIVVDNASVDGSKEMVKNDFPDVVLIESNTNLGFGKANNIGAKVAKGKYLFLLNSDCIILENTIKVFFDYMEANKDGKIGVVGTLLFDKDMNINQSYFKFPTISNEIKEMCFSYIKKLFHLNYNLKKRFNYIVNLEFQNEVGFISGADLFILKTTFFKFNGFDESFFLYYEETDLQKRMFNEGYKRILLSNSKIIHLEGQSSNSSEKLMNKKTFYYLDSKKYFYKKHYSVLNYYLFYIIMFLYFLPFIFRNKISCKYKIKILKCLLNIS